MKPKKWSDPERSVWTENERTAGYLQKRGDRDEGQLTYETIANSRDELSWDECEEEDRRMWARNEYHTLLYGIHHEDNFWLWGEEVRPDPPPKEPFDPSKFTPLGSKLLVEIESDIQTTDGGIIVGYGKIERDKTIWAKVLAVGPGRRIPKGPRKGQREPLPAYPGDRVLLPRSAGFLQGNELDPNRELTLVDYYTQVHLVEVGDRNVGEAVVV